MFVILMRDRIARAETRESVNRRIASPRHGAEFRRGGADKQAGARENSVAAADRILRLALSKVCSIYPLVNSPVYSRIRRSGARISIGADEPPNLENGEELDPLRGSVLRKRRAAVGTTCDESRYN